MCLPLNSVDVLGLVLPHIAADLCLVSARFSTDPWCSNIQDERRIEGDIFTGIAALVAYEADHSLLSFAYPVLALVAVAPDPGVDVVASDFVPQCVREPSAHGPLFVPADDAVWGDQLANWQMMGHDNGGPVVRLSERV